LLPRLGEGDHVLEIVAKLDLVGRALGLVKLAVTALDTLAVTSKEGLARLDEQGPTLRRVVVGTVLAEVLAPGLPVYTPEALA
jgi:uncharacterized membrane protein (DUF441 family)